MRYLSESPTGACVVACYGRGEQRECRDCAFCLLRVHVAAENETAKWLVLGPIGELEDDLGRFEHA